MEEVKKFSPYSILLLSLFLVSCSEIRKIEHKAQQINNYEKVAMQQSKEIRFLHTEISDLNYKIKELESQNSFLKIRKRKLEPSANGSLSIGPDGAFESHTQQKSIIAEELGEDKDLVKFDVYNWKPNQLLVIGQNAFNNSDFEKASQYFRTFIEEYPLHDKMDDSILYKAGVASYKTSHHYNWSQLYLSKLIQKYPESPYYLGAKLWQGLGFFKLKDKQAFYKVVEEFRLKYRNTQEWKILSNHYEEFTQKYKK